MNLSILKRSAPIIVGFGAKARQGKDLAVAHIIKTFSGQYDVRAYSFAAALKREVEEIGASTIAFRYGIPLDPNPPMDDPFCPNGKHSRVLQFHGEYRRAQDAHYWIRKVREQIELESPQFALISDMRHKNEFLFVKSFKGTTVRVTRRGFVDLSRDPYHISEVDLDGVQFHYDITVGDGEVEQLKADAEEVFRMIVAAQEPEHWEADGNSVVEAA
jgi:hypothetical protein